MKGRYFTTNPHRWVFLKFHFRPFEWGLGILVGRPFSSAPGWGLSLYIGPFETGWFVRSRVIGERG